jgi:protease I
MKLENKTIATLIAEGVEDLEYYVPLMRLQEEGAKVLSAGMDMKSVRGKNGLIITPDIMIESLKASELFALILPGGWAPDKIRRYDVVKRLVKEMSDANKSWHYLSRRLDRNLSGHHQERSTRHGVPWHQR